MRIPAWPGCRIPCGFDVPRPNASPTSPDLAVLRVLTASSMRFRELSLPESACANVRIAESGLQMAYKGLQGLTSTSSRREGTSSKLKKPQLLGPCCHPRSCVDACGCVWMRVDVVIAKQAIASSESFATPCHPIMPLHLHVSGSPLTPTASRLRHSSFSGARLLDVDKYRHIP